MTIPVQTIFTTATANGVTTVFAFSFKIIDNDDLAVYANGIKLSSGFAVSGAGNDAGGTVTFSSPPGNGTKLILTSEPELSRTTDYQQFGDFNADTVNPDFDRLWAALQFAEQVNKRSIKLPIDTADDQVINDDATARAGHVVGFDGSGNVVTLAPLDLGVTPPLITPFMETLLDDADAATARATLGLSDASAAFTLASITVKQPAAPTVRLENSNTTIANNDSYGAVEFFGNDASTNGNGVRAKVESISTGTTGGAKVVVQVASGGSTTLNEVASFAGNAVTITPQATFQNNVTCNGMGYFQNGLSTIGSLNVKGWVSNAGIVNMIHTDTQIDIDLAGSLGFMGTLDIQEVVMARIQVVGKYLNSFPAGTVYANSARLFKSWSQMIAFDGTNYVLLGATLDFPAYNSDATNFPAGAVNVSKALLVASAGGVVLRLQNRTTPAVGSATVFQYRVDFVQA